MPRNILIIFLLILALLALGVTATYLTFKGKGERMEKEEKVATLPKTPQTQKTSPEPEKIVTQPQEPTTTEAIDTSDWKVCIPTKAPSMVHLISKDSVILSLKDLPEVIPEWPPQVQVPGSYAFGDAALSFDHSTLAFTVKGHHDWVGIYDLTAKKITPLTFVPHGGGEAISVSWAPRKLILVIEASYGGGWRDLEIININTQERIILSEYFGKEEVEIYDPQWIAENMMEFTVRSLSKGTRARWVLNLEEKKVYPK